MNDQVTTFVNEMPKQSSLHHADAHQLRVTVFCGKCAEHSPMQHVSHEVTDRITPEQAVLRAALHLEEMFELIRGLGVSVRLADHVDTDADVSELSAYKDLVLVPEKTVNLREIVDGLVDSSVISSGTASLFGIPIRPFTEEIDANNLAKFAPGHYFREDGKLVKPENHPEPDLDSVLATISGLSFDDFPPRPWPAPDEK